MTRSTAIALVDNLDSFTYNIVQYLRAEGAVVTVVPARDLSEYKAVLANADGLVLSAGPGAPEAAHGAHEAFEMCRGRKPVFGVCLGHQVIATAYGADVQQANRIMHGKQSVITTDGQGCFAGLPKQFSVTRYHSLSVDPQTVPDHIQVSCTAITDDGQQEVMGLRCPQEAVEAVQFHPEAILSEYGREIVSAFVAMCVP